jgi:hypothetical protein
MIHLNAYTLDVVLWAIAQRKPITQPQIRARWGVHKSTAGRWVGPLEDARQRVQMRGIAPAEAPRVRVPLPPGSEARA